MKRPKNILCVGSGSEAHIVLALKKCREKYADGKIDLFSDHTALYEFAEKGFRFPRLSLWGLSQITRFRNSRTYDKTVIVFDGNLGWWKHWLMGCLVCAEERVFLPVKGAELSFCLANSHILLTHILIWLGQCVRILLMSPVYLAVSAAAHLLILVRGERLEYERSSRLFRDSNLSNKLYALMLKRMENEGNAQTG